MDTKISFRTWPIQISYLVLCLGLLTSQVSQVSQAQAATSNLAPNHSKEDKRALEQFKFAEGIRNREFYDLAAIEYEKIVTTFPNFEYLPEVLFYWGECLQASNQINEAFLAFNQLRERFSSHPLAPQATITIATHQIKQMNFESAEPLLLELSKNPEIDHEIRESAFYYLGEINLQKKNLKEAMDYFSKIASKTLDKKFHFRSFALLNLGYIYRNIPNFEAAENCFTALIESDAVSDSVKGESVFQLGEIAYTQSDYSKAVHYYEMTMSQYSKSEFVHQARVNLGWAYLQLERYKDVQMLFNPLALGSQMADGESLYIYGLSLKNLVQCESALKVYERIEREFPEDSYRIFATFDGIECLFQLDKIDLCLEKISGFIDKFPTHGLATDIRYLKGRCLLSREKLADAAQVFEEALANALNPWEPEEAALTMLAETYRELAKFQEASATYKRLLKFNKPDTSVKALMLSAECDVLGEKKDLAIKTYERVLTEYPNATETPLALLYIAEILTDKKKYREAKEQLNRYLEEYPAGKYFSKALYLRGTLHYYLGDSNAAIEDLRSSINRQDFEERDYAALFLTYALWEMDKENEAIEIFSELLNTQSDQFKENLNPDLLSKMGDKFILVNKYTAAANCFSILGESRDSKNQILGLIGQGKTKFHQKDFDNASKIFYQIREKTENFPELRGKGLAYLGESLRQLNKLDEAFVIFEEASNLMYDDSKAKALVRLGIAKIYFGRQQHDESLRYAISVYVLYDDPGYSPEAMLMAIRILVSKSHTEEARTTYEELEKRYPGALASYRTKEENVVLFEKLN